MSESRSCIRVLVADDEPAIVMSLDFLIRKAGYELYIARNGEEALELAQSVRPDVAVLDIMMPGMDGFEVCARIKSNPDTRHVKVIFLSAKNRKEDIQRGYALGAEDYITKPFSTKHLMDRIRMMLAQHRSG